MGDTHQLRRGLFAFTACAEIVSICAIRDYAARLKELLRKQITRPFFPLHQLWQYQYLVLFSQFWYFSWQLKPLCRDEM